MEDEFRQYCRIPGTGPEQVASSTGRQRRGCLELQYKGKGQGNDDGMNMAKKTSLPPKGPYGRGVLAAPAVALACDGVSLSWDDPQDRRVTGYQIPRRDTNVHGRDEFIVLLDDNSAEGA